MTPVAPAVRCIYQVKAGQNASVEGVESVACEREAQVPQGPTSEQQVELSRRTTPGERWEDKACMNRALGARSKKAPGGPFFFIYGYSMGT